MKRKDDNIARKEAEEALRRKEEDYRTLAENSPDLIARFDRQLRHTYVNPAAARAGRLSAREYIGKTIPESEVPQPAAERWEERIRQVLETGQLLEVVDAFPTPDGIRYFNTRFIPELAPDGSVQSVLSIARDITERKRAEEALRENEAMSRAVLEHSPVGISIRDQAGVLLHVNEAWKKIWAISDAEIQENEKWSAGRSWKERCPYLGDSAQDVDRLFIRESGISILYFPELEIKEPRPGSAQWVSQYLYALRNQEGGVEKVVTLTQDITERKLAEEAVRKSEVRYRELVENANSIILRRDPEGRITFFNEFAQRFFGYREEEILGRNVVGTIVPEKDSSGMDLAHMIRDISRHPEHYATNENENMLRSGERVWVAWTNKPIFDPDGKVAQILCIGNDITERRKAEEALKTSEVRYRTLVEGMSEAVMQVDNDDRVQFVNLQFCQMTGYREDELLGRVGYEIYFDPEEQELIRRKNRLRREKASDAYETRMRKKTGEEVLVRISGSPVTDVQGNVVGSIGVITDITERRRLEEDVLQLQKMEAIGRLSGGVAHDFNNLLQGIMGFAERALRKLPEGDPSRKYLEGIEKTVDKAASLTYQLLAFSRKQVFQPVVIEFNEIVRDSEKMLRRMISEDIEIVTHLSPDAGRVKVDPIQIEQVIMNLAVNSGDAMPKGGRLVLETANVELDQAYIRLHPDLSPGSYVVLTVSDTGCGMDTETLAHIFEPFFTTKEIGKGTGLGLAMVYGIVRQSGGGIEVQSARGRGTTFKVYLPRKDQEAEAKKAVATLSEELPRGTETVLLVEDEEELRDSMREDLSHSGYSVLEAENGEAAFRLFSEHPGTIHLLITDVVMPKMSGPDLARQLAPLRPELKVIFISGYPAAATLSHGLKPLGLAFLQKPFKSHVLLRKVREVLDNPKMG